MAKQIKKSTKVAAVKLTAEERFQRMVGKMKSTGNQKVDMCAVKIMGQAYRHPESVSKVKDGVYAIELKGGVKVQVAPEATKNSVRYVIKAGKVEIAGSFASKTWKLCDKAMKPKKVRGSEYDEKAVDSLAALLGL